MGLNLSQLFLSQRRMKKKDPAKGLFHLPKAHSELQSKMNLF